MERTLSVEEKIRRAEEIYARRQEGNIRKTATVNVNNSNNKKDIKLLRKMIIQIIVCMLIYFSVYVIQNSNYIFSEDFINKANQLLSYDTNFEEIYKNVQIWYENFKNSSQNKDGAIGGANENLNEQDTNIIENTIDEGNQLSETETQGQTEEKQTEDSEIVVTETEEPKVQETKVLTQGEQDIINIKNTTTFIKPVQGKISSKYGPRNPTTTTVPKNHTGVDIAATAGTKIISATSGQVVLASEQGDYGKHLKIQIGDVSIIYAHCNSLYVKQGDIIQQGQEIAEVGSTGNSTGPHLHFEIRISERTVNPEQILEL